MSKLWILFVMFISIILCVNAQTQQGYVKTRGRLVNGSVVAGQRLSGVTVQVKGRNAVVSKANGTFSFPVPANRFSIQSVKKQGYVLVDPEVTARQYAYSLNPLILVLETPSQLTEDKLANERKIRRTLQRQLEAKEDEIEALKEQNKITQEEYHKACQELYDQQNSNEKLIRDMAERYSKIDYDQLDEFNLRVSDCIINGRLTEADSLLRSKGDIHSRIAAVHQEEAVEAAEEADLAQRQANLGQSKVGTQKEKEDIAQDCKHYYMAFLMANQIDSASYYIEQLVKLDSTNIEWLAEAGSVISYYLENYYSLAIDYSQQGLKQAYAQYVNENENNLVAKLYDNIGSVFIIQGDTEKALEYYQKALDIRERSADIEQTSVAASYNNISVVYSRLYDYTKALKFQQKALAINMKVLGAEDPTMARIYSNMGYLYQEQEDYATALDYYQRALSIEEKIFGTEHPIVARSYSSIGYIYEKLDNDATALKCYQKALSIQEKVLVAGHPSIAQSYSRIGYIYEKLDNDATALECYQRALSIEEKVLGTEHPSVASLYSNIANEYRAQGDYTKALELFGKALIIFNQIWGPNHPRTQSVKENIESIKKKIQGQ